MKLKANRAGILELLKSPGVAADLRSRAEAIASAAGPGHEVGEGTARYRARFTVRTVTNEARKKAATEQNLQRAFNAGRS